MPETPVARNASERSTGTLPIELMPSRQRARRRSRAGREGGEVVEHAGRGLAMDRPDPADPRGRRRAPRASPRAARARPRRRPAAEGEPPAPRLPGQPVAELAVDQRQPAPAEERQLRRDRLVAQRPRAEQHLDLGCRGHPAEGGAELRQLGHERGAAVRHRRRGERLAHRGVDRHRAGQEVDRAARLGHASLPEPAASDRLSTAGLRRSQVRYIPWYRARAVPSGGPNGTHPRWR